MQWFLTLFATCLPKNVLVRVWDCLFLEGAEILFRTSIAIWDKLSISVMKANSADSFYSMMSVLTVKLFDHNVINENDLMNKIYSYGPFPLAGLEELREKLTFNISPFQQSLNNSKDKRRRSRLRDNGLSSLRLNNQNSANNDNSLIPDLEESNFKSDNLELTFRKDEEIKCNKYFIDENDEDDEVEDLAKMISCFALLMPNRSINPAVTSPSNTQPNSRNDILIHAAAAANAYRSKKYSNTNNQREQSNKKKTDEMPSISTGAFSSIAQIYNSKPSDGHLISDLNELKNQYKKLKERQRQAYVIVHTASDQHRRKLLNKSASSPPISFNNDGSLIPKVPNLSKQSDIANLEIHSNHDLRLKSISHDAKDYDTEPAIINHLLIKPDDLKCNTVKKSITIVSHANHTVTEANLVDPYIDIKKNLSSLNTECLNYEKIQSLKKQTDKKPYYSDDDSDDTSDDFEDEYDLKENDNSLRTKDLNNNHQDLECLKIDLPVKNLRSGSSSSNDECFNKESIVNTNSHSSNERLNKNNIQKTKLKKKLSDSKSVIKHLVNEEKRQISSFNPFPVRQINSNVTKNGIRLGLYK